VTGRDIDKRPRGDSRLRMTWSRQTCRQTAADDRSAVSAAGLQTHACKHHMGTK
jgi:hypothetical protein